MGLRFTLTEDNAHVLPAMLDLCDAEGVDKFYLSHLVYAGRGDKHRGEDTAHARTRAAMDLLIARAWAALQAGRPFEIVTGNNDTDAVYFLAWIASAVRRRKGRACAGASGGLGRQFQRSGCGQHRPAGKGSSRYLLVGLHGGVGEDRRLLSAFGPGMTRCWRRCGNGRGR